MQASAGAVPSVILPMFYLLVELHPTSLVGVVDWLLHYVAWLSHHAISDEPRSAKANEPPGQARWGDFQQAVTAVSIRERVTWETPPC